MRRIPPLDLRYIVLQGMMIMKVTSRYAVNAVPLIIFIVCLYDPLLLLLEDVL